MKNKEIILNENLINYKHINNEDLEALTISNSKYFFDTESCADLPQEIVDKYNLTQVDYSTLEDFKTVEKGSLLYKLKQDKQLKAKCYVWQFGCNNSDKVYYGNTIEEFMKFIQTIDSYKVSKGIKETTFEIYVHNLSWDIEFVKYYLRDNDFKQIVIDPETKKKTKTPKTFDITENEGIVHNATIVLGKHKAGRKSVLSSMIFRDSMKITPLSLKKISEDLIEVDEIFIKDSEVYNYNIVRDEHNYIPNNVEGWYIYCDIYLLKEWYNQFVVPNYVEKGIKPYTISQISFDSILELSFEEDKKQGKYNHLMDKKGKISNRKIYEEHYGLNTIEKNPAYSEYIRTSYKGGITTVGQKYKELALTNSIKGVSLDITSSYPDKCVNYPLPYGIPSNIKEGKYEDLNIFGKKYDFHFITIGFDGWISKNINNQFGLPIKIYGLTDEQKEELGWTPNEIYTSNCVDFNFVGTNRIEIKDSKRAKRIEKLPYKFIVTLTHYEFECWCKMFNFVRYENGELTSGVHFIDYLSFQSEIGFMAKGINYYFNMKNEGEKEGNKAKTYNSKIIINSFYGKNCSKRERNQRLYDFNKDVIGLQSITEDNRNEWLDDKLYAVQYGSAITSWGRVQLMETALKLGCDKFCYADTDSLKIVDMTKEELINKCNEEDIKLSIRKEDKTLGAWDFEFEFEDFKAIAQKKYMYKVKGENEFVCKCSGLPKDIRKSIKTKEQFNVGQSFIKNGKTKVIGGNLLLPTEFTISDLTQI